MKVNPKIQHTVKKEKEIVIVINTIDNNNS